MKLAIKTTRFVALTALFSPVMPVHAVNVEQEQQIAAFVELNSWYCEKAVSNPNELASALAKDERLQSADAHQQYQWKKQTSDLSLMPHKQGCSTIAELDIDNKIQLKGLIAALETRGYQKQSQQLSQADTSNNGMLSKTVFQQQGRNAVLIYPMDKQGLQEVSLTTANYQQLKTENTQQSPSNDADNVKMHRKNAGTKAENGWFPAESSHGQYAVLMPLKFNDFSVSTNNVNVASVEMLGTQSQEGIKFLASRTFYNDSQLAQAYFDNFVSGKTVPGAPRRSLKHKGYDAVLIETADQQKATSQLVMKVDDTLMLLAVEWPVEHSTTAKQLGDIYFNSFKTQ